MTRGDAWAIVFGPRIDARGLVEFFCLVDCSPSAIDVWVAAAEGSAIKRATPEESASLATEIAPHAAWFREELTAAANEDSEIEFEEVHPW